MLAYETVAIDGVGLIGGSIGLALRDRELARQVVGIGRREANLERAKQVGAIDRGTTDLAAGVAEAEVVVICTPVDLVADRVAKVAAACRNGVFISDAGSTKAAIVSAVDTVLAGRRGGPHFVGSHPIAGDHRTGVEHARADLFDGRTVVLTPTDATDPDAVQQIKTFWERLGARVVTMNAEEHDSALAATSHLPHLVAAALAASTPRELIPLTAGGWRDTTRVAGGDARLWRAIFASNRQHVLEALQRFEHSLEALRAALADGDDGRFEQLLQEAKRTRDALGD